MCVGGATGQELWSRKPGLGGICPLLWSTAWAEKVGDPVERTDRIGAGSLLSVDRPQVGDLTRGCEDLSRASSLDTGPVHGAALSGNH